MWISQLKPIEGWTCLLQVSNILCVEPQCLVITTHAVGGVVAVRWGWGCWVRSCGFQLEILLSGDVWGLSPVGRVPIYRSNSYVETPISKVMVSGGGLWGMIRSGG